METHNTLSFKLPERMVAPVGSFLLSPREVSIWVSSLPVANVSETSRQVFKTIVEFNRIDIPVADRLKIAELFRRPIGYITDNLRKYYYDTPFPLSAKNQKIAVLNRELYAELALAYKLVLNDLAPGRSGRVDRKLLIITIHRTLRCLSRVIYQSVIVYDPIPDTVWREIHRLYGYAEQNNIQDYPVKEGDNDDVSIAELYKQILLLSICSPYRLRQREIEPIMRLLGDWCKRITLERPTDTNLTPFQFVARLSTDAPPLHTAVEAKELCQQCRVLNTQPLVQTLKESFDNLTTEEGCRPLPDVGRQLSQHLLHQLIKVFSSTPKRKFVRTKLNFELKIAVGITAIYSLMTSERASEAPVQQPLSDSALDWFDQPKADPQPPSRYTLLKKKLALDGLDNAFHETIIANNIGEPGFDSGGAPTWTSHQDEQHYETFACKTTNESAGGYCINWQGINTPKIRVGEVIGIQSVANQNQFGIGISRWLRNQPGQGLRVGMQLIAPNATAVQIHHHNTNNHHRSPENALLLPKLKSSEQSASLLLPTLPFKVGDRVTIKHNGKGRKAKLTQRLETTGAFIQFEFAYLSSDTNDGVDQQDANNANFDNIWSLL